ncbi:MAG: CvpA family protein [Kiritimatiellia bacterium]|nr:CvpA family protein [Kiritimatiellia bacterium]
METYLSEFGSVAVDALVVGLLLLGLIRGYVRGLSGELAQLAGLAGIYLAVRNATPRVTSWLIDQGRSDAAQAEWIGLVLVIVASILVIWMIRRVLRSCLQFSFKGKVEKLGGALAGLLIATLLAAILLVLAARSPWPALRQAVLLDSVAGEMANAHFLPMYEKMTSRLQLPQIPLRLDTTDSSVHDPDFPSE